MSKKKSKRQARSHRRKPKTAAVSIERSAEHLFGQGKMIDGLRLLDGVIDRGQDSALTWTLMGKGLLKIREYAQALGALQNAVLRDSNEPVSRYYLAEALFQLGDVPKAVEHFEYIAVHHDHLNAWCNLATIIPGDPTATNDRIRNVREEYAIRLAATESKQSTNWPYQYHQGSPLRIGYVSAFFRSENYMKPVWELIGRHDRNRFEVHLFADDADEGDFGWFTPAPRDRIHLTSSLSNTDLVHAIRGQQLDLLIDLNAYSVPQRLSIYTHRLARVVAAWFNMYATSGMPAIDWIIGDHVVVPESDEQFFTERVARLPQSYLSFGVNYATPDIADAPCLQNHFLTFGSLISQYKITPEVFDAWSRILVECKDAHLMLGNRALSSPCNRDYIIHQFGQRGVDHRRITLLPPAEHYEFLKYYDRIDVALDTFPYNGGTTTTEAMWQGVPTLAIRGDRWASRTSATLLQNCHLSEFVADSIEGYVASAVVLASARSEFQRLEEMRKSMRRELNNAPVCNIDSMVQSFESLLLTMH